MYASETLLVDAPTFDPIIIARLCRSIFNDIPTSELSVTSEMSKANRK